MRFRRDVLRTWLTASAIGGEDEAARSLERNRRVVASTIAGLVLRASSFLVILVSVPLALGLLGPVRFGLWMTLASVVALMSVTDLGIGNGVLNNVARAFGQHDRAAARRYLTSGVFALTAVAAALGVVFAATYAAVPWADLFNVARDPRAAAEAGPATAVFVGTFLLGLPLGLVGQVRWAYQEGFIQSLFAAFGQLATVAFLLMAIAGRASLPLLVLAMTAGPLIAAVINFLVLVRLRPWLMPRWSDITLPATRSVVGVGAGFLVLQLAYTVAFSSDRLIVAHVVGPAAVADYSVVHRLFTIPAGLAVIATLPLWPAYREALARADIRWVRLTLRRSVIAVLSATIPIAILLVLVGPRIVDIWTMGAVRPEFGLYPALGAFTIAFALANVFSMLLNGAQALRFQISIWTGMAIVNLVVSISLASRFGATGVAMGSALATTLMLVIPAALYTPRLLDHLERRFAHVDSVDPGPKELPSRPGRGMGER